MVVPCRGALGPAVLIVPPSTQIQQKLQEPAKMLLFRCWAVAGDVHAELLTTC